MSEAWSEEPTEEIVQDYPKDRGVRGVVVVAVLAVVAAAIAAVTAVEVLVSARPNVIGDPTRGARRVGQESAA